VRTLAITLGVLLVVSLAFAQQPVPGSTKLYTLTVVIEGIDQKPGNIGVLVFNSPKGWPEELEATFRDVVVPAQPGTVTVTLPDLPAGTYAVAIAHDVNKNRKLDKNFLGMPREQWGLSNNPHATIKAPPFSKSQFSLAGDMTLNIKMQ